MSYTVSARKWRPQKFDEIVGQRHMVRTLKNAIKNNRVANAYIFSGTRGVGKTTTARILAKALNCVHGPTDNPCGECKPCRDIKIGSSVDVIEIDGASNRGIDDIRSLRDNVKYAPASGKYKIYIIDEVHMLTKEAFNALLKTLEEPPSHVIFIFATTETNKVPDTILSRCQWFDFKTLHIDDIVKQLSFIAEKDGISINKDYLKMIAKNAEGSMRDAQMLFDQVISFSGEVIKEEDVKNVLGLVDKKLIEDLMNSIIKKDCRELIKLVGKLRESGYDIKIFYKEMVEYIRDMIIMKINDNAEMTDMSPCEADVIRQQNKQLSLDQVQRMLGLLIEIDREMKNFSYPEIVFEMTLIRITQLAPIIPIDSVLEKIDNIERLIIKKYLSKDTVSIRGELNQNTEKNTEKTVDAEVHADILDNNNDLIKKWDMLIEEVGKHKGSLPSLLRNGRILSIEENICIGFKDDDIFYIDTIKKPKNLEIISNAAEKILGKGLKVKIEILRDDKLSRSENRNRYDRNKNETVYNKDIIRDAMEIFKADIATR